MPQEIEDELKDFQFLQVFAIKDGKEEVVNDEAYNLEKNAIKEAIERDMENFKKLYL
jgi:hypothetical protein